MKRSFVSVSAFSHVGFAVVLLASVGLVQAGEIEWDGSENTSFVEKNNWVGGVAPATTGDIAVFGASLTANQPALTANRAVLGLKFQKADGGWTLGGSAYVLTPGASNINDSANTSGTTTIKPIVFGVNTMTFLVGVGGNLVLERGITNTGNPVISLDNGTLTLGGIFVNTTGRTFSKRGAGTLALTGAAGSTFQGGFILQGGKVVIGHKNALGSGPFKPSVGSGSPAAYIEASTSLVGANAITNSVFWGGSNIVNGAYDITFSGPLTGPGSGGGLILNHFGSGRRLLFSGNVALNYIGNISVSQTITVGGFGETEFSGNLSNGSSVRKGNLKVDNTGAGVTILSGDNSYTGTTTVAGGVLLLKSVNAIPGGIGTEGGVSQIILNGGVLGLGYGDFSRTCLNVSPTASHLYLQGSGGFAAYGADRTVNLGGVAATVTWGGNDFVPAGRTLILGAASADKTVTLANAINLSTSGTPTDRTIQVDNGSAEVDANLAGAIGHSGSGAHGIIKTGAGTLLLSGPNSYKGATAVMAGELRVGGSSGPGTVTVYDGASVSGTGQVANLTLQSGGRLRPYNLGGGMPSSLVVTGALSIANGTLDLSNLSNLAEGDLTVATFASLSGTPSFADVIPGPPDRQVEFTDSTVVLKDTRVRGTLLIMR
jgi:autotransporter-associated beta strand protein